MLGGGGCACYVALYIVHARVTDFDIVPIKDLVEWVFGWKMLFDELKESLSDICSDCFGEWRVEPDDVPTASSRRRACGIITGRILQRDIIIAMFERILVGRCSRIKS